MATRAVWTGQLRLSLVSIPVEIHAARDSGARVSFRQIHGPSGKPVRYEKTAQGVGPVRTEDIVKGYDTGDGGWMLIDPDEIDDIRLETKKTLELVQFVGSTEIPPIWFDRPYYVVPADDLAQDAYRVVRDALRDTQRTGLGQLVMRGKEYLAAIRPCGDGLLLETLHYADELRDAEPMFRGIAEAEADPELLDLATSLIDRKTAPFDARAFEDRYAKALQDLIARKRGDKGTRHVGAPDEAASQGDGGNVVDLMAALKRSLDEDGGKTGKRKKAAPKSGGRSGSRATGKGRKTGS